VGVDVEVGNEAHEKGNSEFRIWECGFGMDGIKFITPIRFMGKVLINLFGVILLKCKIRVFVLSTNH